MLSLLGTDPPSWPAQIGSGATLIAANIWFIRWLLKRLDTAETDLKAMNERMITEVIPALSKSTEVIERNRESELRRQGRDER